LNLFFKCWLSVFISLLSVCVDYDRFRLRTVVTSDRILVMSDGKVVEFGPPSELLAKADGELASLMRSSGFTGAERLLLEAQGARPSPAPPLGGGTAHNETTGGLQ